MSDQAVATQIKTVLWTEGLDAFEGQEIAVEIERTDPDEVALHTVIDGRGSGMSLYWSRSRAIELARQLLNAATRP